MLMVAKSRLWNTALLAGALAAGTASGAYALDLTIGGVFDDVDGNDVLLVEFRLDDPGLFTAFTSVNDSNNPLPPPVLDDLQLQLFFGTGPLATTTDIRDDDGEFLMLPGSLVRDVAGTTFSTGGLDAAIETQLAAGDYTLGLSTFDNDAAGPFLGNGFDSMGGGTGEFRVHLLGVDEIQNLRGPDPLPASPSFPGNNVAF